VKGKGNPLVGPFRTTALAVSLSFVLIASSCGGDDDSDASPTAPPGDPANIAVSMVDNEFLPAAINVPVGMPVTITATNDGAAVHNLLVTIDGTQHGTELMVNPGAGSSFEVTFPEAGEYDFVCGFHLPDMKGTITAE
jgi:plastocyanin